MRILLVGEFSGLHRELKKGLVELGHHVTIMAAGDGWKDLDCDVRIPSGKTFISKLRAGLIQYRLICSMRDYDVVQFIFPHIFNRIINRIFINILIKQNRSSFLLAAGSDAFYWLDYKNKFRYSPHDDNLEIDHQTDRKKGGGRWFLKWNRVMVLKMNAVIPVAYDYRIGYKGFKNIANTIPMPIQVKDIQPHYFNPNVDKITILYGISRPGFKGSRFIEPALDRLKKKYSDRIEILKPERLPFAMYLDLLVKSDIVVDQALSYSYGMNALLALAFGKVTLSGAEPECLVELGQSRCPVINILPSVDDIFQKLDELLSSPDRIFQISIESRSYVENVHDSRFVAGRFLDEWSLYN